jgi:hypothetical protein
MTVITKQGEQGIQGGVGPPGRQGPVGEAIIGPQGIQGPVGPAGGALETMTSNVLVAGLQTFSSLTPADLVTTVADPTTIHFLQIATNAYIIHFETRPSLQTTRSAANVPVITIEIDVTSVVPAGLIQIPYGTASVTALTIPDFLNYDLAYASAPRVVLSGTTLSVIINIDTVNNATKLIVSGSCLVKI